MTTKQLLKKLNTDFQRLHGRYERLFWVSYMGDHRVDEKKQAAHHAFEKFKSNRALLKLIEQQVKKTKGVQKKELRAWQLFFGKYQIPEELLPLREKITKLETKIHRQQARQKEGYTDPKTKRFVAASANKMRFLMRTHDNEQVRKACFHAREKLATGHISEYIQLVNLRNTFARSLGYEDFYAYKLETEEGMTKKELFSLFDRIFEGTQYAFKDIRKMEKKMPGLRKPWNSSYMLAGDFVKEKDPYFQFEDALLRWGKSFAALGIEYRGGVLQLDLVDRKGKHNNGFCHWPDLVSFTGKKRIPGSANFTCNVVPGQVGAGSISTNTLFHEGGHAAHLLNSEQTQICLNSEYPPMSTAWAETQSMFLDGMFSSIDWATRYAHDADGNQYPFDLFKRMVHKLHKLNPLDLMGILFVSDFERNIYEAKQLTKQSVLTIAKHCGRKYLDYSVDTLWALSVPHIYSWESSGSYHGYGLAELAVAQWREYFYKKYGYIVDNPRVGKEMTKVWKLGSSKTFQEFVKLATRKKLSARPYLRSVTKKENAIIQTAQKKIRRLESVPRYTKPIHLGASIRMVDGKKLIATNKKSFEDMAEKYKRWLRKQTKTKK